MKILTLTMSPAVDVEFHVGGTIDPNGLNRAVSQSMTAGGKGINVSRAITKAARRDRVDPDEMLKTVAPVGGVSGLLLKTVLESENIALTAIEIEGNTRVNASVIPESGKAEEINAPGTPLGDARKTMEDEILSSIEEGDTVVIAGSCPKDVEKSYPLYLIEKIKNRGGYAVLDCDGEALKLAVHSYCGKPNLIKPNTDELAGLTGMKTDTVEEVMRAAESLKGITVITTMAGDGAVLTDKGKSEFFPTEKRTVVRQKGAGDTFLGAFVYRYRYCGDDIANAMRYAGKVAGDYVAGEELSESSE